MELAIRTMVYQPKIKDGKETSLLEYVKQRSYGELEKQFEEALKAIVMPGWDCSAYGAAEYISFGEYKQDKQASLPKGNVIVFARSGNCEGYRVELCIINDGVFVPVISAKYLSDRDGVWEIAKQIDEACYNNGLYGY
ncbi:hypothetical protein [Alteromonas oceanisediminis]|uniref:hypothetical protein n=1 Tax=Alteromonas oceanisediminis TaxID=2836180 RepID=UPI001BD99AE8|nr:hypothetical protein [Alteromonas oceanisediminis]MBT0587967.1 hypothetical protein [Alteromonas oceanisediminis]